MSEVLAQLEKKGGGGLPDNLDNVVVCGREGAYRIGMYTINGVPTFFSNSISVAGLFVTINTSNGLTTFTEKGTYLINTIKNATVTSQITQKEVGDTLNFYAGRGQNYCLVIVKLD